MTENTIESNVVELEVKKNVRQPKVHNVSIENPVYDENENTNDKNTRPGDYVNTEVGKSYAKQVHSRLVENYDIRKDVAAGIIQHCGPGRAEKVVEWANRHMDRLGDDAVELVLASFHPNNNGVRFKKKRIEDAFEALGMTLPEESTLENMIRFLKGASFYVCNPSPSKNS